MAYLLRSQDMAYVKITMVNEAATAVVMEMGKFGKLHLTDLSERDHPTPQFVNFKKRVAQCVFWEKKLQAFRDVTERYNVPIPKGQPLEVKHTGDKLVQIQDFLEPLEKELTMNIQYVEQTTTDMLRKREFLQVLRVFHDLKIGADADDDDDDDHGDDRLRKKSFDGKAPLLVMEEDADSGLIAGVIPQNRSTAFHRMLYRVSKGANTYVQFIPIEDELAQEEERESLSVFYIKTVGRHLTSKIMRLCKAFDARTFSLPASDESAAVEANLIQDIKDAENIKEVTRDKIKDILHRLAGSEAKSPLLDWEDALKMEKMTCQTLMMCQFHMTLMNLEGWCPAAQIKHLDVALARAVYGTGLDRPVLTTGDEPPAGSEPPSYFPMNKFTAPFQAIVDTYGVPRYHEVNPGLFTIVTFPFLFGVMYGDIFHGFCIFAAGLYLLWNEKKFVQQVKDGEIGEIPAGVFGARYCLTMMGFFAFYCGLIYNDMASNPIQLFDSTWTENASGEYEQTGVYPWGVDYRWYHQANSLIFFNSLKMKLAVTLGVIHMVFGICMSLVNHCHTKNIIKIVFEFIPRVTFMLCTFGYMIFMIVYKFTVDWSQNPLPLGAPNLIQVMIELFLSPGNVSDENQLFEDLDKQASLQFGLLVTALCMIPFLFFAVPCITHRCASNHSEPHSEYAALSVQQKEDPEHGYDQSISLRHDSSGAEGQSHGEHTFSDDLIHNGIHSIEFILGCVSNTASYLRLWALSLAHSQLSEVFWRMCIMQYGLELKSFPFVVVGVSLWMCLTFFVLLTMDVLECFLHALRLHWVEFQNKFYNADGHAYQPFVFNPTVII